MPEKIEMAKTVNEFRVGSVPTVFYIPDFITDSEHDQLLNTIYDAPISKWKSLKNRRLQNWGGVVHEKGLIAQDLPPWLTRITRRITEKSGLFPSSINHVLINEYLPNQGIMPHQDGPAYYPVVAILSLGSPVVIDFTPHPNLSIRVPTRENSVDDEISDQEAAVRNSCEQLDNFHPFSIILMPRSLLIFKDMVYSDYLHGIKDSEVQGCNKDLLPSEVMEDLIIFVPLCETNTSLIARGKICCLGCQPTNTHTPQQVKHALGRVRLHFLH
ncbi:alpha-ketoglutarate-dependent dioxygenase alkB 6 isoform X9 [Capsicum chacoense]